MDWVAENKVAIWAHMIGGRSDLYFFVADSAPERKLACLQIMLTRDRELYNRLAGRPDAQLEKLGMCVKVLQGIEPADMECLWKKVAALMKVTFPKVPAEVLAQMETGDLRPFQRFWSDKNKKLPDTGMILKSFGTPFPFPLSDEAFAKQTDEDGRVWHYNPCSAHMSVLPYRCIPAMRDLFEALTASKGRAVVAPDAVKLMPGDRITQMHADEPGEDALLRYQIILLREKKRLLRVLPASLNTNEFIKTIEKVYEGFSTIGSNVQLRTLIERFGVGVPEGQLGVLVFKAGTIHWETENATPQAETFRLYSGIQFVGEKDLADGTVTLDQLMQVAYMAEHGCDLSSFSKAANSSHPLFVNAKGLQHWGQRQGPNPLVEWLLEAGPEDHRTFLQSVPDFDLRLRGLLPEDVHDVALRAALRAAQRAAAVAASSSSSSSHGLPHRLPHRAVHAASSSSSSSSSSSHSLPHSASSYGTYGAGSAGSHSSSSHSSSSHVAPSHSSSYGTYGSSSTSPQAVQRAGEDSDVEIVEAMQDLSGDSDVEIIEPREAWGKKRRRSWSMEPFDNED
jgi:hypothetical protein